MILLLIGISPQVEGFSRPIQQRHLGPFHTTTNSMNWPGAEPKPASSTQLLQAFPATINGATLQEPQRDISRLSAAMTKLGMMSFIASMCILLPLTLLPQRALFQLRLISRNRMNQWALVTSQWCARILYRMIPFCRIDILPSDTTTTIEPAIWVCNHTSMLDVFILLIVDRRLRGTKRRPIKIIYWKNLEDNPVTKLLFRTAGFIPVDMAANAPGQDNEYDVKSFKQLLKDSKQAMADGFDLGILPEGQLNPHPEQGVLPIFTGAFTLAKFSKRKIGMISLYNVDKLWGAIRGMKVLDRHVKVCAYKTKSYDSADAFTQDFTNQVGRFGQFGTNDHSGATATLRKPSPTSSSGHTDED